MRRDRYIDPRRRLFEPVSRRMRTSLRRAQCICPRRKNFDGGDWRPSSHHSGALETGVRRKSSLRAAKPRKSRTLLGDARKCELSGSGWWSRSESNCEPLSRWIRRFWQTADEFDGWACIGDVGRGHGSRLFDSVAEHPIPSPSLCSHPCQQRDMFVDVVDDERIGLPVVPPVQPADVLRQSSLPRDRHGEE